MFVIIVFYFYYYSFCVQRLSRIFTRCVWIIEIEYLHIYWIVSQRVRVDFKIAHVIFFLFDQLILHFFHDVKYLIQCIHHFVIDVFIFVHDAFFQFHNVCLVNFNSHSVFKSLTSFTFFKYSSICDDKLFILFADLSPVRMLFTLSAILKTNFCELYIFFIMWFINNNVVFFQFTKKMFNW